MGDVTISHTPLFNNFHPLFPDFLTIFIYQADFLTMAKYIITADTYQHGYGSEITFFGIFDSKEDAINWIVNNPIHKVNHETFDFFSLYDYYKTVNIYEEPKDLTSSGFRERRVKIGERTLSKEEYAENFVNEFNGSPVYLGGYVE